MDEAHVQHAICFVQNEDLQAVQADDATIHQVEQSARRRHQDVDALSQLFHLRLLAHAAEDDGMLQVEAGAVRREAFGDLSCQFTRGGEHQGAQDWLPARN